MDAIGVKTFPNCLSLFHKTRNIRIGNQDVGRCDGLLLVEAPDVQLVNAVDTRDLFKG
jgi:hypothetical protein